MIKRPWTTFLFALAILFSSGSVAAREVRVGIYANEPKVFMDSEGSAAGIFPDLIREIATNENWSLNFVACEWQRCLAMIQAGELDLLPDVAKTEARVAQFDFHKTPGLNSWSAIYRNPDVKIQSILDLENKRVGVLKNSVQQDFLRTALDGFGLNASLIPLDSFEEGFAKTRDGQLDAIATNHHSGRYASEKFQLIETPVIFLPSSLFFVTTMGQNADLLSKLDLYLERWRNDPQSYFFRTVRKWAGQESTTVIPQYLLWALGAVILTALFMLGIASYLRTEVRKRTQEIKESERRLNSILNDIGSCIYIKDMSFRYQYVNRSTCELLGRKQEEIIGKSDEDLYDEKNVVSIRQIDQTVLDSGHKFTGEEIFYAPGADRSRTYLSVKIPLVNAAGQTYGLCGISTDITDQLEFAAKLERLACFDTLTGLFNRTFFFEEAVRILKRPDRNRSKATLILINLDNFRDLNDTQGHEVGDILLKETAEALRAMTRQHCLLARLAGDSFIFLVDPISDDQNLIDAEVNELVQEIDSAVKQPKFLNGFAYYGSASIGVSSFDPSIYSVQDGITQAELALYHAKSVGRGSTRFFEPHMQVAAATRLQIENELRVALYERQLEVFYQPQVDQWGVVIGLEALVRWQHPKRGLCSPAEFVPLAESTGQILSIGQFVLETVCEQLQSWSKNPATSGIVVAVNVSAREFFDKGFIDRVAQTLIRFNVDPSRLELELTESQLVIGEVDKTLASLYALKSLGLQLSLDDFGTGYSSLSRLNALPFDQLKIDGSFVRELVARQSSAAIVKTIIELGKNLGLQVIAEGVETQEQMDALLELGCTRFQGFLHGKPMPVGRLNDLLAHSPKHSGTLSH
jgi:diguanylate cyclase (GGDEF)-like protein/PAS domain S-box-containing protein